MNESINKYKVQLQKSASQFIAFITRHRVTLVFFISSAAVAAAVYQASTYLNPTRNEVTFTEGVSQINYSEIDQATVEKLQQTQDRPDIDIDPDFDPTRNNPFAE